MSADKRRDMRAVFFASWQKHRNKALLEPLESHIIDIILLHPEYHTLLEQPDVFQEHDFAEANPFLHMSLHLALREQVQTNRPVGIEAIFMRAREKQETHQVEHVMMDCLAAVLWEAQQAGVMPDEQVYLERLKQCF